jgi:hypothetical protein
LKSRLERERSNDTTSGGSNVTVIEGHVPVDDNVAVESDHVDICDKTNIVEIENESDRISAKLNGNESSSTSSTTNISSSQSTALPSCLLRRDSARASVKKKVRCSETAEVIPVLDYFVNNDTINPMEDDEDDVFSDSAPAQVSRGNMCTPYVERKGSLPMMEALPDWFPNPRLIEMMILFLLSHNVNHSFIHSLFVDLSA